MFYGWVNVVVLWLGYALIVQPAYYGFGSLVGPLSKGLGVTLSQASLGFTVFVFTMALANPVVALVLNRIGTRLTITLGALLYVVAGLLMGTVVSSLPVYYAVMGLLMGFGCALTAPVPIQMNVSLWFVRKRATAMAIALTGGGFGAMVFAPLMARIVAGSSSWRTPWLYVSGICAVGCVLVVVFLRNHPADMGLLPDGDRPGAAGPRAAGTRKSRVYKTGEDWEGRRAFRTRAFYLILVGAVTVVYGSGSIVSLAVTYFASVGIPKVAAAGAIGLFGVISIPGRLLSGVLCDRIEPRYVAAGGFLLQVLAMSVMLSVSSVGLAYVTVTLYGIAFGLTYVCLPNLVVNYFGVKHFATVNGVLMMLALAAGSSAPFITGTIVDVTKSFSYAWGIVLLLSAASMGAALLASPPRSAEARAPVPAPALEIPGA